MANGSKKLPELLFQTAFIGYFEASHAAEDTTNYKRVLNEYGVLVESNESFCFQRVSGIDHDLIFKNGLVARLGIEGLKHDPHQLTAAEIIIGNQPAIHLDCNGVHLGSVVSQFYEAVQPFIKK